MKRKRAATRKNNWKAVITFRGEVKRAYAMSELMLRVRFSECVKRYWGEDANLNLDQATTLDYKNWYGKTYTLKHETIDYHIIHVADVVRKAAAILGEMGGKAGKGRKKVRGDSEYYRELQRKGVASRKKKRVPHASIN